MVNLQINHLSKFQIYENRLLSKYLDRMLLIFMIRSSQPHYFNKIFFPIILENLQKNIALVKKFEFSKEIVGELSKTPSPPWIFSWGFLLFSDQLYFRTSAPGCISLYPFQHGSNAGVSGIREAMFVLPDNLTDFSFTDSNDISCFLVF